LLGRRSWHQGSRRPAVQRQPLDGGAKLAGISRSRASLRFFGDDLVPEEITAALGASPTEAHRKGEQIVRQATTRLARTGSCRRVSSLPTEADLERHIASALEGLTSDLTVWAALVKRFDADVFCGVFLEHTNEGFELSPAITRVLAERGLVVGFDVYGPCE